MVRRCLKMAADPCKKEAPADHLVYGGELYDVDSVTRVESTPDGAELLEVWATKRGDGDDS